MQAPVDTVQRARVSLVCPWAPKGKRQGPDAGGVFDAALAFPNSVLPPGETSRLEGTKAQPGLIGLSGPELNLAVLCNLAKISHPL